MSLLHSFHSVKADYRTANHKNERNRTMKKLLSVLLASVMLFALLVPFSIHAAISPADFATADTVTVTAVLNAQ